MIPIIDEMLTLTAEIAEALLLAKDAGATKLEDSLKLNIIRLAELAATDTDDTSSMVTENHTSATENQTSPEEEEEEVTESATIINDYTDNIIAAPLESTVSSSEIDRSEQDTDTPTTIPATATTIIEAESLSNLEPEVSTKESPLEQHISKIDVDELRRAFSINDLFLFRRELFNGSARQFDDTLAAIATLHSFDEVKIFLTSYLGLDPKRAEVKEFAAIIARYF